MHFGEDAWLDFARKLLPPDETWSLQQHLAVGCQDCSKSYAFWTRVTEIIARDAEYDPTPSDVRSVTAAFVGENREMAIRKLYIPAQLIFDSFHVAAPVGFRSALMQARHVVFGAGLWTISLRVKSDSGNRVFLAGHITRTEPARSEPGQIKVSLLQADSLLASATVSHSGEFHLEYRDTSSLRLVVEVSETETLDIPLPDQDPTNEEISFGE